MARPAEHPFVRFYSSVEGHLVSRFGSSSASKGNDLIGASYHQPADKAADPVTGEVTPIVTWDTTAIAAITREEWARFSREYERAVREGALRERTEEEFWAMHAAADKAAAQAQPTTQPEGAGPAPSDATTDDATAPAAGRRGARGRAGGPAQE